ncbi:MAG: methytransferase partner Trm112 [Thermoplasmatales archaeon]
MMKKDLLDIICCPVCKGDLVLSVDSIEGDEIIKGTLECRNCNYRYPIEDGIPNLLPPK